MDIKTITNKQFERSVALKREFIDEESRTVEIAFSSDVPYRRWFGDEILSHDADAVDMEFLNSGTAPLLADHNPVDQIGVIEKAWIDEDRKGRALVRFGKSARASEFFQDVVDGIRSNISVGYTVSMWDVDEEPETPIYTAKSWRPLETSIVAIPADNTVGVGRNKHTEEVKQMADEKVTAPEIDVKAIERETRAAELARIKELTAVGKMRGFEKEAEDFINRGKSVADFREFVWDQEANRKPEITIVESPEIGMSEGETKRYSFMKLVRALATNDWSKAGFERECSQAFEDKTGRSAKGAFIPHDVLMRDLVTNIGPSGGYVVAENLQTGSFIDMLRNSASVMKLGARTLTGLVGDADIPKQTGGATAYWVNEGGDLTESAQTLGQIRMTPKTVGCYTDVTRRMMLQSSIDVEGFIRMDFAAQMALAIDLAAISGTGASGQPRGILNTSGIGSVTLNAANTPDWGDIVDLETAIATDNALMGNLAYMTNATIAGNMKQTDKASGAAQFILANGMTNGYPVEVSNQVPAKYILFGNWGDMIIGMWSGLDVTVDSTTLGTSGGTRVICFQDLDIIIRHAESFASGYKA